MVKKTQNDSPATAWYVASFESFAKSLNGESASFAHDLRKSAIAEFEKLGFPTTRDEEWKYTDVSPIAKLKFTPVVSHKVNGVTAKDIEPFTLDNLSCHRVVFVNGHFSKELSQIGSLPAGVRICSLAEAVRNNDEQVKKHLARHVEAGANAFIALGTAFLYDGLYMAVPKNIVLDLPVHLVFLSSGLETEFAVFPRNLIVVDDNSQCAIIESHVSLKNNVYFTNAIAEVVLGSNAIVEYDKLQLESERAFHISNLSVSQDRSSSFTSNAISLGGSLVRNNVLVVLGGEGAEATLNGLYLGTGKQHIDNHTTIDHARPHCPSHELYKGILSGKSKGVFNGKIKVRQEAQKTDAKQTNKNLILSDEASVDTKPQLEIFANDVKCTHGATIGQLDEEAIFYLRSRGVGIENARDMLIYAFASDVIDRIKVEPLRELLHEMIHDRLEKGRQGS
ncbi:MAG TPA: Fe-S cluster assembly protein SufD [Bacteroidota bacterium]|nr:Fe-S cluster assembly protein SufD [Bacteroidota bacterium]